MHLSTDEWSTVAVVGVGAVVLYLVYQSWTGGISSDLSGLLTGGGASTGTGLESTILGALSSFENVAASHNNPGAICGSYDSAGNCLGPATFASLDAGIAAAEANISKYLIQNPAMTVQQFVQKWSGASGNVLDNYVDHVSNDLGLDPSDPISNAAGGGDADAGDEGDSLLGDDGDGDEDV